MPLSHRVLRIKEVAQNEHQLCLKLKHRFVEEQDCIDQPAQVSESELTLEEARHNAGIIISTAMAEAESIIQKAKLQSALKATETAAKAKEEGYREGYRQAQEEAVAEAAKIRKQAQEVLNSAENERRQVIQGLEKELISLAREMAEKIICAQLKLEPAMVTEVAKQSIAIAENREKVTIYVHPDELKFYESHRSEMKQLLLGNATLYIIADGEVSPGGCKLETDNGKVDASLKARWQALCAHIIHDDHSEGAK